MRAARARVAGDFVGVACVLKELRWWIPWIAGPAAAPEHRLKTLCCCQISRTRKPPPHVASTHFWKCSLAFLLMTSSEFFKNCMLSINIPQSVLIRSWIELVVKLWNLKKITELSFNALSFLPHIKDCRNASKKYDLTIQIRWKVCFTRLLDQG